jgi:hypothetical protein
MPADESNTAIRDLAHSLSVVGVFPLDTDEMMYECRKKWKSKEECAFCREVDVPG